VYCRIISTWIISLARTLAVVYNRFIGNVRNAMKFLHDGGSETFKGNRKADKIIKRIGRKQYTIPASV
jgi:hypothetical protein